MNKVMIFLLFQTLCFNTQACINTLTEDLHGRTVEARLNYLTLPAPISIDQYQQKADTLLMSWKKTKNIATYNDYGAVLIYIGKYQEALKIFSEIETMSPNRYATAANIGTAYELLGLNDSAFYWIKKA